MSELGLKARYQVVEGVRVSLGYSAIYWDSVARASSHISQNVTEDNRSFY